VSEKTLRKFLERLDSDKTYRKRLKDERDWPQVIKELDLSPADLAALSTEDEDALRRLAGGEVKIAGQNLGFYTTNLICSWLCFCVPFVTHIDTPNSKRDCGTGPRGTACCEAEPD
jgi:hypothetical protein